MGLTCDITNKEEIEGYLQNNLKNYGTITGLINNAANDPKVDKKMITKFNKIWKFNLINGKDLSVGLTGSFLCSQIFGNLWLQKRVIVNIASDLSVIAPDQSLYRIEGCRGFSACKTSTTL